MRGIGLFLVFIVVLVGSLAVRAPASLLSNLAERSTPGLSVGSAQGTVWNGQLRGLTWRGAPAGSLSFQLRPGALARGALSASLQIEGPLATGAAHLERPLAGGLRDFSVSDVTLRLTIAALDGLHPRVRARGGEAVLAASQIVVRTGACQTVQGSIGSDVLTRAADPRDWVGPFLSGPLACDGGDLVASLTGADASADIVIDARLTSAGQGAVKANVQSSQPGLRVALSALGFTPEGGGLVYERAQKVF